MKKQAHPDVWISVDTETSGPSPSTGSLISIGACLVDRPEEGFYVEINPDPKVPWSDGAETVHKLSRAHLAKAGSSPAVAMAAFERWITGLPEVVAGGRALFVGFNATFDWMFTDDAFRRYLGRSPFGISGLDLKAFAMGRHWTKEINRWGDTAKRNLRKMYPAPANLPHTHNALDDAREQAQLARALRQER